MINGTAEELKGDAGVQIRVAASLTRIAMAGSRKLSGHYLVPLPPTYKSVRLVGSMLGLLWQEHPATCCFKTEREGVMSDSVYKVIELVGTSKESWEKAASTAVTRASKTLRDLRVAEVVKLDMQLDAKGKIEAYRAKLNVSFKFEGS
jgi:dodecin